MLSKLLNLYLTSLFASSQCKEEIGVYKNKHRILLNFDYETTGEVKPLSGIPSYYPDIQELGDVNNPSDVEAYLLKLPAEDRSAAGIIILSLQRVDCSSLISVLQKEMSRLLQEIPNNEEYLVLIDHENPVLNWVLAQMRPQLDGKFPSAIVDYNFFENNCGFEMLGNISHVIVLSPEFYSADAIKFIEAFTKPNIFKTRNSHKFHCFSRVGDAAKEVRQVVNEAIVEVKKEMPVRIIQRAFRDNRELLQRKRKLKQEAAAKILRFWRHYLPDRQKVFAARKQAAKTILKAMLKIRQFNIEKKASKTIQAAVRRYLFFKT